MFKTRRIAAELPSTQQLEDQEAVRIEMLTLDPQSKEAYDRYYDQVMRFSLRHEGQLVIFDGGEHITYCGKSDEMVVFAISIFDDEPTWLIGMLGLQEGEVPCEGEHVYLLADAKDAGKSDAMVTLAQFDGEYGDWDSELQAPFTDAQLDTLVTLFRASQR